MASVLTSPGWQAVETLATALGRLDSAGHGLDWDTDGMPYSLTRQAMIETMAVLFNAYGYAAPETLARATHKVWAHSFAYGPVGPAVAEAIEILPNPVRSRQRLMDALRDDVPAGFTVAIVGTGGNCEAIEIRQTADPDGTYLLVTDGNAMVPFDAAEHADDYPNVSAVVAITDDEGNYPDEPAMARQDHYTNDEHGHGELITDVVSAVVEWALVAKLPA